MAALLVLMLGAQAAAYHGASRPEIIPLVKPLGEFPHQVGAWVLRQEGVVEPEVQAVLKADDTLTREYSRADRSGLLNFFVAYFRSQRTGKAPHSPKNCLPGAGWVPTQSDIIPVDVGSGQIHVNRYVVARGEYKSLVLYWYQSHNRVTASEYLAKVHLVLDSMRYNRSDVAMARVVVPIVGNDVDTALQAATDFIRASYPELTTYLPPA